MSKQKKYVFHASDANGRVSSNGPKTIYHANNPVKSNEPEPKQKDKKTRKDIPRTKRARRSTRVLLAVLLIALAVAAMLWAMSGHRPAKPVSADAEKDWPVQIGVCQIDAKPERVVSLSPMLTRIILSLPGKEALCGVTEYCQVNNSNLPSVGTPLMPNSETIQELGAQYVLTQTPLPDSVVQKLEANGAVLIQMPMPGDLQALRQLYGDLAAFLLGEQSGREVGTAIIDRMQDNLNRYKNAMQNEKTALLLPDLSGAVATADTAEWALLGQLFRHPIPDGVDWMSGVENPWELIQSANPDLLFVPADVPEEQLEACLGDLQAVQNGCVVFYDRQMMESLSPMTVLDLARGIQLVCPEIFETA